MRIVILLNPKLPVEHFKKGNDYAEASFGFSAPISSIDDNRAIATALREAADMLEAPSLPDNDLG